MDQLELTNTYLMQVDLPSRVQQEFNDGLDPLPHERRLRTLFIDTIPELINQTLDEKWSHRLREVASGFEWQRSICELRYKKDFLPSVRGLTWWENLNPENKAKVSNRVEQVRSIYKNWNKIVLFCTMPGMDYVDVRDMTLD